MVSRSQTSMELNKQASWAVEGGQGKTALRLWKEEGGYLACSPQGGKTAAVWLGWGIKGWRNGCRA